MKLENEEVIHKNLDKWTEQTSARVRNFSEKIYLYCSILTLKKLKYFISYTIKLYCQWGDVLSRLETRNRHQIIFRKVWFIYIYKMLIKRWIFYYFDEIEIRLPFYRSFSPFWHIFGDLCIFSSPWGKRWLEFIGVVKSKVIQNYNPNIKPEIFKI